MSSQFIATVREQLALLLDDAARACGHDPAAAGVLVALSGGPDSVALLDVAAAWCSESGRPLVAAHVNHHLRGEASDHDQGFCEELCRRLSVPLEVGHVDARTLARERGRGLEDAARTLRHQHLEAVRTAHGLAAIATGHHRDDLTETVILRLFRGAGLDGLAGLAPRQGSIIRPLLPCRRQDVLAHLASGGLTWRDDTTNHDGSNRRGRVRHELLPLVRDIFGPGADEPPARLADLVATDLAYLTAEAQRAWGPMVRPTPDGMTGAAISATALANLPKALARRVIRHWLGQHLPVDLALAHVDDVHHWAAHGQSGSGLDLPGGVRLCRVFDVLAVTGAMPPAMAAGTWRVLVEPLPTPPDPVPPPSGDADAGWRLVTAADRLQGNLRLRHPREGDRLAPFGLDGTKKLSDLMREQRIPVAMRPDLLVVEDDAGPLWVVGLAQDERTRVLPTTRQAVTILVIRRRLERRR